MSDSAKKENKVGFFEGVKAEWSKITWPSKELLAKQTIAVVAVTVVVGLLITVLDYILQFGISLLS
ncbi:MAG: preprotein translocase subunit SecE [Lachnospiraceae bacterium]|jgi:preprotein translocase subunit SecE|nr:preprotein translocase subunit SecE [Lachnospiraceae bacterium]